MCVWRQHYVHNVAGSDMLFPSDTAGRAVTDASLALPRSRFVRTVPVLSEAQRAEFNSLEMAMRKEFISQQLIHLVGCLDTNEEGGRSVVEGVGRVGVGERQPEDEDGGGAGRGQLRTDGNSMIIDLVSTGGEES